MALVQEGLELTSSASEYTRRSTTSTRTSTTSAVPANIVPVRKGRSWRVYALDPKGRRRIRQDLFEERQYAAPVKIGYEDSETAPVFLKAFLAKGENTLFWMNGGHYYKDHGTLVTAEAADSHPPPRQPGNLGPVRPNSARARSARIWPRPP